MTPSIETREFSDKGYSQVVILRADGPMNLAFISGQVAVDSNGGVVGENDFETQCRFVFDEVKRHLETAGSDFDKVLKLTVFLTDLAHFEAFVEIRKDTIKSKSPPASTAVVVDSLVDPALLIEIEALALVP